MQPQDKHRETVRRVPDSVRRRMPYWLRRGLDRSYWLLYDLKDFVAESIGWLPSHRLRLLLYRHLLKIRIGRHSSIHRGCRFYRPPGVCIGQHTVVNRDVLLDGRTGLVIGDNVSISEGTAILTLAHDPDSPTFENSGAPVHIGAYVFVGARVMILPGVTVGEGAVLAAGAVVTRDVAPFTIVAGVPARSIGERRQDLAYVLDYRKWLG